jgi:hypothetical protein
LITIKIERKLELQKETARDVHYSIQNDYMGATSSEEIGDGPNGTKYYQMKPKADFRPGEYCLAQSSDSCSDFGVD